MDTFRTYVEKYIFLMRPKTMMIYLFPLTLGFASGMAHTNHVDGWRIACAYLSFLSGCFFSSTLNFYADVEADSLHNDMYKDQPISTQPFVTGKMGKVETPVLFALSALACVGYQFAMMITISFFTLGVLYSHPWFRFKAKPVLDALCNASGAVLVLTAGWKLASPGTWPPVLPLVFGFLFAGTLYLPSVANDVPFDEPAGFRTSGVVFGAKRLLNAMIPLCGAMAVVAVLVLIGPLEWQFKLFIAGALPAAIVFTWGMHFLYEPPTSASTPGCLSTPSSFYSYFILSTPSRKPCFK